MRSAAARWAGSRHSVQAWLNASLQRYPAWVREAVIANPSWVERRLASNPQWINEQLKHMATEGDLFA